MNINFKDPAFKNLSPEKINFLEELAKDVENMPSSNSIGYLMTLSSKLKSKNINFNNTEMDLIYQILTSKMSPKEREKFNLIKNFISKPS